MSKHHPNVRATPQALEKMRELNEAWRVLSDPSLRASYDRARRSGMLFQPPAPIGALRPSSQPAGVEFGAGHPGGSPCLVVAGVLVVLVITVGILLWGLNQQYDLVSKMSDWRAQIGALLQVTETAETSVALSDATPTPDLRCRSGCESPPAGCVVKGDVAADGARYFYLPNDAGYASVSVSVIGGDRWFCTSTDAQAAGWTRKAPTPTPSLAPPPADIVSPVPRRSYVVCADGAETRLGPGDQYSVVSNPAAGTAFAVTGVNGDWSVVTVEGGLAYIRTNQLCPPTRVPAESSAPPAEGGETGTPVAPVAAGADPAATTYKYPAPQLVLPTNGSHYGCARNLILEWSFEAPLAADEYFLVESKPHERQRWTALYAWTKATTVTLGANHGSDGCDALWWPNTGVYEWRVSVVRGSKVTPTYLSPFSPVFTINYSH